MSEAPAAAALAFRGLSAATVVVEDMHRAIARRTPARASGHDHLAPLVYRAVRDVIGGIGHGAEAALRRAPVRPLTAAPAGLQAVAAVNALLGDRLEEEGSPLALGMTAHGDARTRPRLAVLVHGLGETERAWRRRAAVHGGMYADRVLHGLGYDTIAVRYNTGAPILENGRRLCALVAGHDADEIVLVGHSMGGLVARAAAHGSRSWTERLRAVVCLGSPHHGAPLEKAVTAASSLLARLPETAPGASILDVRSRGIRDLRVGVGELPAPEGAQLYGVAACITRDPRHLVGRLAGDLLVREDSASGRHAATPLPFDAVECVGGLDHFDLLNHPEVDPLLRKWLT